MDPIYLNMCQPKSWKTGETLTRRAIPKDDVSVSIIDKLAGAGKKRTARISEPLL